MGRATVTFASLAAAWALSGCGVGSGTRTDGAGMFLTCDTDTRAAPYQAGMQVASSGGTFTLRLLESQPGPPVKGQNTWTLQVDETSTGLPLAGLDVSVNPYMPDHRHGTRPVGVTPAVSDAGASAYTLTPVYLYMSGVWEVKFVIVGTAVAGGVTELATIPICIP